MVVLTQDGIEPIVGHPLLKVLALQFSPLKVKLPHIVRAELCGIFIHLHLWSPRLTGGLQ